MILKNFAALVKEATAKLAKDTPIEIWFQDEMRIGQKNGVTRLWAKREPGLDNPKISAMRTLIYLARFAQAVAAARLWSDLTAIPRPCRRIWMRSA